MMLMLMFLITEFNYELYGLSTKLQNDYNYFKDMLKSLEKQKKTPGNGFAKMKCKEKIAELEKIFNEIDYAAQVTYD